MVNCVAAIWSLYLYKGIGENDMYSKYITPDKQYHLKTDKYICNKFGLAEFFAKHYNSFNIVQGINVLDVGCGALPLGIFLADQHKCEVTGVELNLIACDCAIENIKALNLEDSIEIINGNFVNYIEKYVGPKFDLIVANPPVDDKVASEDILKYANDTFETLDAGSFSYLTNSWHSSEGKDLNDYIFQFGQKNLQPDGRIMIVFCTIDCSSPDYVYRKAKKYDYEIAKVVEDYISVESIGAQALGGDKIYTYMAEFRRR